MVPYYSHVLCVPNLPKYQRETVWRIYLQKRNHHLHFTCIYLIDFSGTYVQIYKNIDPPEQGCRFTRHKYASGTSNSIFLSNKGNSTQLGTSCSRTLAYLIKLYLYCKLCRVNFPCFWFMEIVQLMSWQIKPTDRKKKYILFQS